MSLQHRRHQCSKAIVVGLGIMVGVSAAAGTWANVIIGTSLMLFVVASCRSLDRLDRKQQIAIVDSFVAVVRQSAGDPEIVGYPNTSQLAAGPLPATRDSVKCQ